MGRAVLAGVSELLGRLDVLAGRRLLYVAEVRQVQRRLAGPALRVDRRDRPPHRLAGIAARRGKAACPTPSASTWTTRLSRIHRDPCTRFWFTMPRRRKSHSSTPAAATSRPNTCATPRAATRPGPTWAASSASCWPACWACRSIPQLAGQWADQSHGEEPPGEAATEPARRTLGEFELLSELGRGGMGVVYRAWQPSLGRQVALKKLLHTGDAKTEARFRREIRALGQVEHPTWSRSSCPGPRATSGSTRWNWSRAPRCLPSATSSSPARPARPTFDLKTWTEAVSDGLLGVAQGGEAAQRRQAAGPPPEPAGSRPLAGRSRRAEATSGTSSS